MSIELEPSELTFQRPFTSEVTQTLRIRNPNFEPVVFKVKTTAPKQYCVRPNSGRIESGKEVEVQVLLQAMKSDPPADYKCRDKFLVQSISITADREATNVQEIWSYVEKTEKSAIRERKIRVVYLPPGEGAGSTHDAASLSDKGNRETSFMSPPPYASPSGNNDRPTTANDEHTSPELAAARATIIRLERELNSVNGRLQQELNGVNVRLRNTAGAAADAKGRVTEGVAGMGMTTHPPEGIPVQVCAALCLFTFLLAWFFF